MSKKTNFVTVGKIHSTQGLKGDVFVSLFSGEAEWQEQMDTLYLSSQDNAQPELEFAIDKIRSHQKAHRKGLVLKLENVDDCNAAEELVGHFVMVPENFLVSDEGESIYLREILGFKVVDGERGEVGTVSDFADNGAQDILVISKNNRVVGEVPLVEPILQKIDFAAKTIFMVIPPGLLQGDQS